jgi:hypothetical protein
VWTAELTGADWADQRRAIGLRSLCACVHGKPIWGYDGHILVIYSFNCPDALLWRFSATQVLNVLNTETAVHCDPQGPPRVSCIYHVSSSVVRLKSFSGPPISNATPWTCNIIRSCQYSKVRYGTTPSGPVTRLPSRNPGGELRAARRALNIHHRDKIRVRRAKYQYEARQPEERTVLRIRHPEELRVRRRTARGAYVNSRSGCARMRAIDGVVLVPAGVSTCEPR